MSAALLTGILAWACFATAMFTSDKTPWIHRWAMATGMMFVACWMMGQ